MEQETDFNLSDIFGVWVCDVCRDLVDDPKTHSCPPRLVIGQIKKQVWNDKKNKYEWKVVK